MSGFASLPSPCKQSPSVYTGHTKGPRTLVAREPLAARLLIAVFVFRPQCVPPISVVASLMRKGTCPVA